MEMTKYMKEIMRYQGKVPFSYRISSYLSFFVIALAVCTLIGAFVELNEWVITAIVLNVITSIVTFNTVLDKEISYCGVGWLFFIIAIGCAIGSLKSKSAKKLNLQGLDSYMDSKK